MRACNVSSYEVFIIIRIECPFSGNALPSLVPWQATLLGASSAWQRAQEQRNLDAQAIELGVAALRLISTEDDRPAGLALIASIRKRLYSLPSELAAEEMWRVRLA